MASSKQYLQKKIIVIGAGVSGLACAGRLRDLGFNNIKILEARDRVGGRTYTIRDPTTSVHMRESENNYIEIGAQFIHGEDDNAIFEIAHSEGLVDESAPDYMKAIVDFKANHTIEEIELINNFLNHFDGITENIIVPPEEEISFSEYLNMEFKNYIRNKDTEIIDFLKPIFNWYCNLQCELNGCVELTSVSLELFDQYKYCAGSPTVQLKYGYSSIVNLLCEKISNETFLLNKEVKTIDYAYFSDQQFRNKVERPKDPEGTTCNCVEDNNKEKIQVTCTNGEVYEADHVIVSIPLGYLKKHSDRLFVPSLSQKKRSAIHAVGFGAVNKIFLEFSEPFWEPATIYHVVWYAFLYDIFTEDLASVKGAKEWMTDINRFAYSPGHPNMLCAWIVGKGAIKMEEVSEDCILFCCHALLQRIIRKRLPKPERIIKSSWHSDPYTLGSYSYLSTNGCTINSNIHLAEPIFSDIYTAQHPVLQFAGEATHTNYYSTVHGAYESGIREANRLFDHYR